MTRMISAAARAAGFLVLAGFAVTSTSPAATASAWTPTNESYAVAAAGRLSLNPVGEATYSGGSPVVLPNADAAGLLHTGIITDRAGSASASATIPGLVLRLPGHTVLRAAAIASACRFNGKTMPVTGTSRITSGSITRPGHRPVRLAASPPPNTRIMLPGVAVLMLNRQFTGPRGTLTVAAVRIRMLRGHQKLVLAASLCAAANLAPVPGLSGRALRLTLGGVGLMLLGGLAYQLSKRRKLATAT